VMLDVLGSDEDALEAALGLGELAGLTVTNEADAYDVSGHVTIHDLLGNPRWGYAWGVHKLPPA